MTAQNAAKTVASRSPRRRHVLRCVLLFATPFTLIACGHPSAANNELRAQNLKLQNDIAQLQRQHDGDQATIAALQSKAGTVPTLPQADLDKLFTTHGISLGKLTGGEDTDPSKPGDEALRVAVTPTDQDGQKLKAAGSFVVDAFDLAEGDKAHLGHWELSTEQSAKQWYGSALLYGYVLKLPWQTPPAHPDVTVKVTFTDALTHRQFTAQTVAKVKPPAAAATTQPSAKP